MKIVLKIILGILAAGWFLLLWCYNMLLSSDIPVNISDEELHSFLVIFVLSIFLTLAYVKFVDDTKLHYFLSIPTLMWGLTTINSLTYHYHPYDTLMDCLGFIGCVSVILLSIFHHRQSLT